MEIGWTEQTIKELKFVDFLNAFMDERRRRGQVVRLKKMGHYESWETAKRRLFNDCQRVLRKLLSQK